MVTESTELQQRTITTWMLAESLRSRGRATAARELARSRRRLYRRYLTWAGNSALCGSIAESVVHASIEANAGSALWLPPSIRAGSVSAIAGHTISVGGPLDSAGYWMLDPENPAAGQIPFGVEVKNIRTWIYPWSHECWDLLAKVADMPDVVPVLVARRIHYITFNFFYDIGALGHQTNKQWFYNPGTTRAFIDPNNFREVTNAFGFADALLVPDPHAADDAVVRFFRETIYKPVGSSSTLASRSADRWQLAAPIAARYPSLRDENLPAHHRRALWSEFSEEIRAAELVERGKWLPTDFDA